MRPERGCSVEPFYARGCAPGAPQQLLHRDHGHLFFQPGIGPNLSIYAVNVAVPLVYIETGPTGVLFGSHRSGKNSAQLSNLTACTWRRGDCVLLDYRTMHAGLANFSQRVRPIVYMVYACPWFFDDVNHINRISLDMPIEHYNELPESVRPLLIRAFSYATRPRWHEAGPTGRAAEPMPGNSANRGKIGRNDPCFCGSGKKYKQYHGRNPQSISAWPASPGGPNARSNSGVRADRGFEEVAVAAIFVLSAGAYANRSRACAS
jgi:hypothetical protein